MFPARSQCFPGWQLLYAGYLMSELYTAAGRIRFLCVAENADLIGLASSDGGPRIAPVAFRVQGAIAGNVINRFTENIDEADLRCVVCQKQ